MAMSTAWTYPWHVRKIRTQPLVWSVSLITICVKGNPQIHVEPHDLPVETLCESVITFVDTRLNRCLKEHLDCHRVGTTRPTRLLRIELPEREDDYEEQTTHVFLEDGSDSVPAPYFTISHCWGGLQPIQLTTRNESELKAGVPPHTLPKTFREAVDVCCSLGIRYLWIDSLCIVQDQLDDWGTEAARMYAVYANAQCNIAATGAINSTVGLSIRRNVMAHQRFLVTFHWNGERSRDVKVWICPPDWTLTDITYSPLNRRAWVVQERFLSHRIIHFATSGIYWEYSQDHASANDSTSIADAPTTYVANSLKRRVHYAVNNDTLTTRRSVADYLYPDWLLMLDHYVERRMTNDSDGLVALNGIAREIQNMTGGVLVCGMWKDCLIRELLWEPLSGGDRSDPPELQEWRAPSWNWASSNYLINPAKFWWEHRGHPTRVTAVVTSIDVDTLPSGQVKRASLTLKRRLLRAQIRSESDASDSDHAMTVDEIGGEPVFNRLPDFPYEEELTFMVLMKCGGKKLDPRVIHSHVGLSLAALILRKISSEPATYTRVSVLRVEKEHSEVYKKNELRVLEEIVIQ